MVRSWHPGGTLLGLLSFLLVAVDGDGSRIALASVVGVLLALGPLDHVVVTVLHVSLGVLYGANVGVRTPVALTVVVTVGNLSGGIDFVTFTHAARAGCARS